MGASRKLQGEIDRVLKKVQEGVDVFDSIWNKVYDTENANQKEKFEADLKKEIKKLQRYRDQIKTWIQSSEIKDKKALMDARKQIEREMERFKVCEKETKTKAFSKEGLGQQPKTDPKEKAKAETRDWLNNVVSDLESQIDNFEAEIEGLSIKKGKQRPPRLVHLEKSITRHKAHIKKLESILRLLDNDELSPEQVNDVKDFLDDYVERNQEDFDEFSDVEDLYSTLPMEKVEALEDMVSLAPSSLVKGVASVPTTAVSSTKSSIATSLTQPTVSTAPSQSTSQDQTEDTASQESNSESVPQTPPPKGGNSGPSIPAVPIAVSTGSAAISVLAETISSPVRPIVPTTVATILSSAIPRSAPENTSTVTSIPANLSITLKDDESMSFPPRRPSPAITEIGIGRGIARGTTSQALGTAPITIGPVPGNGSVSALPGINDLSKRNILNTDEKINSGGLSQQLVMPLGSKVQPQQVPRTNDAISSESANTNESPILGGRVFSPPVVSGVQWRPLGAAAFQNQSEISHFRGRPEISADHREKYIQRLQQVQQQGGSLLNVSHITGINQKQFPTQQPNPLLQQFNSQSSSISSQVNLGVQGTDAGHIKSEEEEQLLAEDGVESSATTGANKQTSEDDTKIPYSNPSAPAAESNQLPRDTDPSPGQPLQPGMSSSGVGVIGRRSVSDLGAIGDNLTGTSASSGHDQLYNLQMLEAAFHKLPQPKDSERAKTYIPRHPAVTPASYPQVQPSIVSHPSFWERIGSDTLATDMLFFAFYYQQNTYQQYMAARELKKQSWRFHRRYNTWFQRHVEPQVTTDEYERGSYVYFDFHVTEDGSGWCQRIKNDFTFEYNFLEDELSVQTN
ncbi:CCR4-NOT transcription complex subunit 3 isoform X2 [Zea mays]|uniref:Transcription regulator NOT2/NOT3/NOT5 family protein n=1 Tax=Zea mays TaxID=4577 RepID=A0A1D6KZA8_MAIZE|nr:CCR4-NOT transcription complex subunit 3 isoform X2 [Zea mays]ONM07717.1 transcription regulator NOT2/NOT3/NOT5 family protein [Zea mays]|eukprot:XP_020402448.1 CCR4-NOT transcription complex subunit 3 isoform X2 [Zea mays]